MNATHSIVRPVAGRLRAALLQFAAACVCVALTACGGSADAPPPPETGPVLPVPPTITQQPASLAVSAGQPASFTVAATGTAPLAYQWQRDGVAIAGATSTTYTLTTTVLGDSGATFRAIVSNVAGSATSNAATLTVTASAPVLTISPQPASTSVIAGAQASFTVGGTCSSGTLAIQWQRSQGGAPFADIAGATGATYSFMTVLADSGAQFRAVLDCSGQSSTPSNAATLTVTAPGSVTLSLLPLTGLRDQAPIAGTTAIDQQPSGSYVFIALNQIKRLSADLLTIDTVAGDYGNSGSTDGAAATALFNRPSGLTHDGAGNIYIADTDNETIRRIATDGTVSTIAGAPGVTGTADGTGNAARFNRPWGIALGTDGDLYVSDLANNSIRRVTTAGAVTTYAGGTAGYADGLPLAAMFNQPQGIAVAANGDVLVADNGNGRIRRILRSGTGAGAVQTLAGNGNNSSGVIGADGIGVAATIISPAGLYLRGNTLTVRDGQGLLRQIDLTSTVVTTLTGSRTLGEGFADGTATTARLRGGGLGFGITGAPAGGFVTADDLSLRLVSASGDVRTLASASAIGRTPAGVGTLPQEPFGLAINDPASLTVDPQGRVVVAEPGTSEVRRIDAAGNVTLVAGLTGGFEGSVDGVGSAAQFTDLGISITSASSGVLYVGGDYGVRRIGTDNAVTMLAGSTTQFGGVDGNATTARFNRISSLAVGPGGDVFAADFANNAVRRIDASGNVTTYAGVIGQSSRVDGPIATARFQTPAQVAFAPDGTLYVNDNGAVRTVAADGSSVSTLTAPGFSVGAIAVDSTGTLYYADAHGLYMLVAGAASGTLLIPVNNFSSPNVLGTSPRLFGVQSLAVLGPKQLAIISGSQLLVATLP